MSEGDEVFTKVSQVTLKPALPDSTEDAETRSSDGHVRERIILVDEPKEKALDDISVSDFLKELKGHGLEVTEADCFKILSALGRVRLP